MNCTNKNALRWIDETNAYLGADSIRWIDGSEYHSICQELVSLGQFIPLNAQKYPNCYLARSQKDDVARVEDKTFICSRKQEDSGPTNHWSAPGPMYAKLKKMMTGCMKGKTLYVIPYLMGPSSSPFSKVGFELTDSLYVAANMCVMSRVGAVALSNLRDDADDFVRGVHSVGTLDPDEKYICHFPEDNTIISYNSNYGGNALQGKKCFALRIATTQGRKEGWLAEHMLILGITPPGGEKKYIVAAFPSACGKTNLAMLMPPKVFADKGWKVETVGDDIAWLRIGDDGRLYATNPESGFFGVAPSTSESTNPNAIATIQKNTIFTNVALNTDDMTPWWEGLTPTPPAKLIDWQGQPWTPANGIPAAHPNSRFTAPASQCPSIAPEWESPQGVPVSAIIFGGRRKTTAPLVYKTRSWNNGVYTGLTMGSERTAAAAGNVGELRRDPFAMLPFIGYHIGDYVAHWIEVGKKLGDKAPAIFHVNWFRRDEQGKFLWPGYGENIRVLEWVLDILSGKASGVDSPLGVLPKVEEIHREGIDTTAEQLSKALFINSDEWLAEVKDQLPFFISLGNKLPKEIFTERQDLIKRLGITIP